jgi:hypothetical protein
VAFERLSKYEYDEIHLARTFFEHHRDVYDSLIVWLDFPHSPLGGRAGAWSQGLRNDVQGIGPPLFDNSEMVGSDGQLASIVHMGSMDNYPEDPDEVFRHVHTPLSRLAHEYSHRWLTFVSFRDQHGNISAGLRARNVFSHWSFYTDSDLSVMLGNDIQDNGDGTFTTLGGLRRYSDLDLYLMGLIPPEQVPDVFYVDNVPDAQHDAKPRAGVTFTGDRVNVTIEQIIAAEGPRIPTSVESQKHFRTAFVLLTADGRPPRPEALAKLQRIRRRWVEYFHEITRGLATMETTIHLR